jgi:hypothetical protein
LVVDDEFKLADFGFAKFSRSSADLQEGTMHVLEGGTLTFGTSPSSDSLYYIF